MITEREQEAIKMLDWVIVLFRLENEDYNAIDKSLRLIANAYREGVPITLSLVKHLERKGYLPQEEQAG